MSARRDAFWTDKELAKLKRLRDDGRSYQEIADMLGRSPSAVQAQVRKRRIPKAMTGPPRKRGEVRQIPTIRPGQSTLPPLPSEQHE
jgi:IS30 family transposase